MSKKRRSSGLWKKCENEKCQVCYALADIELHEKNCPPTEPWNHAFIKDGIYYFIIECDKADKAIGKFKMIWFIVQLNFQNLLILKIKSLVAEVAKRVQNPIHSVFVSESVSKACGILENDSVLIKTKNNTVVKKAMLVNDEKIGSACLTKNGNFKQNLLKENLIFFLNDQKFNIYFSN